MKPGYFILSDNNGMVIKTFGHRMKFLFGTVFLCIFSSCNLLSQHPNTVIDGTNNGSTTNTNNKTVSTNNSTTATNNTTSSTNNTTSTNNKTTTTGPTTGTTTSINIPFSSMLTSKRSIEGLVAQWSFDNLEDKVGDADLAIDGDGTGVVLLQPHGMSLEGGSVFNPDTFQLSSTLRAANAFTIELWLDQDEINENDSMIIGLLGANSAVGRNFSLSIKDNVAIVRLRTEDGGLHFGRTRGVEALEVENAFNSGIAHFVWTYDGVNTELWIDGTKRGSMPLPGSLSSWSTSYKFTLGDGRDAVNWNGDIFYTSVYKRSLRKEEIEHHFALGSEMDPEVPVNDQDIRVETCNIWPFDLFTEADIQIFSDAKCKAVSGNVRIPSTLQNLNQLENLETISGDLIIDNSSLTTLSGLDSLRSIMGGLHITNNNNLVSLTSLNGLTTLGNLRISDNSELTTFDLAQVDRIEGHLILKNNVNLVSAMGLEHLESVGESLVLDKLPSLSPVSFGELRSVKTLSFSRFPIAEIKLPKLLTAQSIWFRELPTFTDLNSPVVPENFNVHRNPVLKNLSGFKGSSETFFKIGSNLSMDRLSIDAVHLKGIMVINEALNSLDLSTLQTTTDRFYVERSGLTSMAGALPELISASTLQFHNNPEITTFSGAYPKLITSEIYINLTPKLTKISDGFSAVQNVPYGRITNNGLLQECDIDLLKARIPNVINIESYGNSGINTCP